MVGRKNMVDLANVYKWGFLISHVLEIHSIFYEYNFILVIFFNLEDLLIFGAKKK